MSIIDLTIAAPCLASRIGDWSVLEETTLSDHWCIEFILEQQRQAVDKGRGSEGSSPYWNVRRLCRERLRVHLETTRLIDELGWVEPAGSLEDTVRSTRQKVVAACDDSMPRRKRRQAKGSMFWWNDQLAALRRECLAARRRFTRSKGDSLLHEAWKREKAALRRGIKKSRLQCWKDLKGEVEKDPWGLAFKIVTKKLVTRRKTPGLDNLDRVKYIVRCLFPHVGSFQRQGRSSCVVQRKELFTLEEQKRAGSYPLSSVQGEYSAGDRRSAKQDPQRGDRGIP